MATLLEEARNKYGEASIETAPAYFEYGNALFRESQRQIIMTQSQEAAAEEEDGQDNAEETDGDKKKPAATTLPEEESQNEKAPDTDNNIKAEAEAEAVNKKEETEMDESGETEAEDDDDDAHLALDMMETAFAVLDNYVQSAAVAASDDNCTSFSYLSWAQRDSLPRFLTNIGDVLSTLERHADAADVYTRELQCREDNMKQYSNNNTDDDALLQQLIDSRKVAEANILVAEELLACPEGQDVVTTETQSLLVEASELISYATGYYEKARDQLQETVYLMGKVAGKVKSGGVNKEEFDTEKENVCFTSTLLMAVGEKLAEHDEQQKQAVESTEPAKKKAKK